MASKRRYLPIGDEPVYDYHFDRLRMESVILNAESRKATISHAGDYNDPTFLNSLKAAWEGNEEGRHFVPGAEAWRFSRIPGISEKIEELDEKFKRYQQKKVNEGNRRPKEMPPEIKEPMLKLEARLDIAMEELDVINKHLSKIESKKQVWDDSLVLRKGPRGHGWLRGGILWEIDGQAVRQHKKILIVDDRRSCYDGMQVADYKEFVSKPWKIAKLRLEREHNKICKGSKGDQLTTEMKTAWSEKKAEMMEANPEWKDLFALKKNGKPAMPAWPQGIKNQFNGQEK